MEQNVRNKLRNVVTKCRKLLEESISEQLQGQFGIHSSGKVEDESSLTHLDNEDIQYRRDILDHFDHIKALGYKGKDALAQLVREIAFTHLNRFCAYKMMAARDVRFGGKRFRDAVGKGLKSQGFLFFLADHPDDEKLFNGGKQDVAYRHFLDWLGTQLSEEIGVLFSPNDPANRLYPPQRVLNEIFDLLNGTDIKEDEAELREAWPQIWSADETIGWVYQYFTPKEVKEAAKKKHTAPPNSYELAFRNQFFTPRYVVEFLTDNTLGRIWYEMRRGETRLVDDCRYMVRRPNEIFLSEGEKAPECGFDGADLTQEELLLQPHYIPDRPKKDPRELRILDPACGSGHFLLYCFDLLLTIYDESYDDPELGAALQQAYADKVQFAKAVPGLILANNLHGVDIDRRASQIAALALWLRCQREYHSSLIDDRPRIDRTNVICAEPMPGSGDSLAEFGADLKPTVLRQLVALIFEKMKLAGEAGSLLEIENEIRGAISAAKMQWDEAPNEVQLSLFDKSSKPRVPEQRNLFDVSGVTTEQFWKEAEQNVLNSLRDYAGSAENLQRALFADDAARGFAFIDLCQNRFDVIVMNPPFGLYPERLKPYFKKTYGEGKSDIAAVSVKRATRLLTDRGRIGAITTRTLLVLPTFEKWRDEVLLLNDRLTVLADLGYGVLDEAVVEAGAYVVSAESGNESVVCNSLDAINKSGHLLEKINLLHSGKIASEMSVRFASEFTSLPASVIAHQIPSTVAKQLVKWKTLESQGGKAKKGMNTSDDPRFLHAAWEVPIESVGAERRWVPFAKGGEWSPFWDDVYLVVDWIDKGDSIKNIGGTLRNVTSYFQPGLTYPQRTTSSFGPRIMPNGCIFSTGGMGIHFSSEVKAFCFLGLLLSRPGQLLIEMSLGCGDSSASGTAARNYTNGMVNRLPFPQLAEDVEKSIADNTKRITALARSIFDTDETSRTFHSPIRCWKPTLSELCEAEKDNKLETLGRMADGVAQLQSAALELFQMTDTASGAVLNDIVGPSVFEKGLNNTDTSFEDVRGHEVGELIEKLCASHGSGARFITKNCQLIDRRLELIAHTTGLPLQRVIDYERSALDPAEFTAPIARRLLSFALGCKFGRWDAAKLRYAIEVNTTGLFAPLSGYVPATPTIDVAETIVVDTDGLLVDDDASSDDIVRGVTDVLEFAWPESAAQLERDCCDALDVDNLRQYLRRPTKGGYFFDHIGSYSKKPRKAPIYWLLQSSRKNYAIWLYYHKLNADTIYKALKNYVEPKIRIVQEAVESAHGKAGEAKSNGKSAREIRKYEEAAERHEGLRAELEDFQSKLVRAAELHIVPDLNDGVPLNAAVFHELIPWSEASSHWRELLDGKYAWSAISKQLREKALVKD